MKKVFIILTIISIFSITSLAQNNLKERMLKRLPQINSLKNKGTIGENNKGYLQLRTTDKQFTKLINEENADRLVIYKIIAKKAKTNHKVVGEARAIKIAKNELKGRWLQNPSGKWYKK